MLEYLFGSKTRLRLLQFLFRHPDKPFFVRELTRLLETQINAVRREIAVLEKVGLVNEVEKDASMESDPTAKMRKYYQLNKDCIIYPELQALMLKAKAIGEQAFLTEVQDKAGEIKLFILTGCFTQDKDAATDMLLVGAVKERAVAKIITDYEKEFGYPIRYTVMSEAEFYDRRHMMDRFLFDVFEGKLLRIVDKLEKR